MRAMSDNGLIFHLEDGADSVITELDLIVVPENDFPLISNLSLNEQKKWYSEQKAA